MPLSIKITSTHLQQHCISFSIHQKISMSALVDIWTMEAAKQQEKPANEAISGKATSGIPDKATQEPRGYFGYAGWSWSPKLRQLKMVNYSDASLFMLVHCFSP